MGKTQTDTNLLREVMKIAKLSSIRAEARYNEPQEIYFTATNGGGTQIFKLSTEEVTVERVLAELAQ